MKVSNLKSKANNPRKIDQQQLDNLVKSIDEFPKMMELRPIVYDPVTMEVLGGNQRLTAIKKLGMKDIPDSWTRSAETLTDDEKRRFVIQDNHQSGEWDFEILNAEWGDIDLEGIGITTQEEQDTIEKTPSEKIKPFYESSSMQVIPSDEYIIIKCPPNSEEWEHLKSTLKLKKVNRAGYSADSSANVGGIERVLTWRELIKRMSGADSSSK